MNKLKMKREPISDHFFTTCGCMFISMKRNFLGKKQKNPPSIKFNVLCIGIDHNILCVTVSR